MAAAARSPAARAASSAAAKPCGVVGIVVVDDGAPLVEVVGAVVLLGAEVDVVGAEVAGEEVVGAEDGEADNAAKEEPDVHSRADLFVCMGGQRCVSASVLVKL